MISDQQFIDAYQSLRSTVKVAKLLGIGNGTAHRRLQHLQQVQPRRMFSQEEKDRLELQYNSYADAGRLSDLAQEMGREKHFLMKQARKLGLTTRSRPRPYHKPNWTPATGIKQKLWYATNPHPRGMLGKRASEETKRIMSQKAFDRWHSMTAQDQLKLTETRIHKWKAGWREVGGRRIWFRSRWEANYGRYLEWLRTTGHIAKWEHEPHTFWFLEIKRGTRSYLPDFRITENNGSTAFHEVKGWMDPASKTKIKRMAKYHPDVKLIIIGGRNYRALESMVGRMIPGWEFST